MATPSPGGEHCLTAFRRPRGALATGKTRCPSRLERSVLALAGGDSVWEITGMASPTKAELYRFDEFGALMETRLPLPRRQGKVRDVYDLGESLLIVSTDRISAFDFVLPCGIPQKGRLLTQMSRFWFDALSVRHHLLATDVPASLSAQFETAPLEGRVMVTEKASVIPFECVVRGYLEGSGLREYQAAGEVCGIRLPDGLRQCDRLPRPIFTPATKAEEGHDENVAFERMVADLGRPIAEQLQQRSLDIYRDASEIAAQRGILIADTKFEFGWVDDEIVLIDEVLTPDSSRFWDAEHYQPGHAQPSFDKQFVREWLSSCDWDKASPPPVLPADVIEQTRRKYQEAFQRLAGEAAPGSSET